MRDGWREVPLGEVFEPCSDRVGAMDEPPVFSITKHAGVVLASDYFDRRIASESLATYKLLRPDDWAYSTIHIDEGSIARNTRGEVGAVSPMYTIMRFNGRAHEPAFFELLLRSQTMLRRYSNVQQGSINRRRSLPWKVFAAMEVHVPSRQGQRRIADLFAALGGAIDAAKASSEKSATLLSHLVDHELREAGGASVRLGEVMSVVRGGSPRPIDDYYTDAPDGLNWVRIGDVGQDGKYIVRTEKRILSSGLKKTRTVEPGDFVLSNSMSFGRPYIMRIHGCIHDGWLKLSGFRESMTEDFLYYLLRSGSMQDQFESLAAGTGVRNLNKDKVAGIGVVLPDLPMQRAIASRLDQLGETRRGSEATVTHLESLRRNLLSALLSGEHEIPESYDALIDDVEGAA